MAGRKKKNTGRNEGKEEFKERYDEEAVDEGEEKDVLSDGETHREEEPPEIVLEQLEEESAAPEETERKWQEEKDELLDRLKRKQADIDNLRRISKMEQAEAREYALHKFLGKILPVLDNLERGLESARASGEVSSSHIEGLEMIRKQLMQLLEQEGVSMIEAEGLAFDPHCHHAVMQVDDEEAEPGSVLEEMQKGYRHHDRVLRPAMVKVCREQ